MSGIIISNDPDLLALQRIEEAEEHFLSQICDILAEMVSGTITPAQGQIRIEELDVWWKREMEEIEKIGAS